MAEGDLVQEVFPVKTVVMDLEDLLAEQDLQDLLDHTGHRVTRVKWVSDSKELKEKRVYLVIRANQVVKKQLELNNKELSQGKLDQKEIKELREEKVSLVRRANMVFQD